MKNERIENREAYEEIEIEIIEFDKEDVIQASGGEGGQTTNQS